MIRRSSGDCNILHASFLTSDPPRAARRFARYRWRNILATRLIGVFIAEDYCALPRNNFPRPRSSTGWRVLLVFYHPSWKITAIYPSSNSSYLLFFSKSRNQSFRGSFVQWLKRYLTLESPRWSKWLIHNFCWTYHKCETFFR